MKQEGLSYSYRNLALAAIKHYHDMHDILLNWRKIARFLGERKFDNDLRAYTRPSARNARGYSESPVATETYTN